MKINRVSLASSLLLILTACNSGGGGSNSSPSTSLPSTSNTQNVQVEDKIKALQAKADEIEKKLAQAEQAANTDKNTLAALKIEAQQAREAAEKAQLAADNNATLRNQFQTLQAKAYELEKKLTQAEQTTSADKKELDTLKTEAEKAKIAAENAAKNVELIVENALKKAEENRIQVEKDRQVHIKKLTKIARSANIYEAEDLANRYSHLSEKEFSDYLAKREEKYQELNTLALKNGFDEGTANTFANNYRDKEEDEIADELQRLKVEKIRRKQEQEAYYKYLAEYEQKRQKLIVLAKEYGLKVNEAREFSYQYADKEFDEAKSYLEKRQNLRG